MASSGSRPAGADNYLRWRRTIDEHLELGRRRFDEYAMFSWLRTKADPRTRTLRTRWTVLAEQTGLSRNYVCNLCGDLRRKGHIAVPEHRGRRGKLVELAIDKFPLADGTYTALARPAGGSAAPVPASVQAHVSASVQAPFDEQDVEQRAGPLTGRPRPAGGGGGAPRAAHWQRRH